MTRKLIAVVLAAACLVVFTTGTASAKTTLKLATMAPKQSPWGKVFTKWTDIVKSKTDGEVDMEWSWNGVGGDEKNVVEKIASGQLHGSALTAVGLSTIDKSVLALQVPGTFSSWAELDKGRAKVAKSFKSKVKKEGFYLLGWGDVGKARVMSVGFAINGPGDLKGKNPAMIRDDVIAPALYSTIGGVSPVAGSITEFLPMLQSKKINVMNTPALAAEQLQWASRLTHMNTGEVAYAIGALVLSNKALDAMPKDQSKIVKRYGKKAAKRLTKNIRAADDAAFARLKKKMTTHEPTAAEKAEWKKLFTTACKKLGNENSIDKDTLKKIGACSF